MGERAAYRVKVGTKISPMMRKQWYVGSSHDDLRRFIYKVAKLLVYYPPSNLYKNEESCIGDGCVALRDDLCLDNGRVVAALFNAIYRPPFDSIERYDDVNCDIDDHGIFEIELCEWNVWNLNHYEVLWSYEKKCSRVGVQECLATITFDEGKILDDGMHVKFHVSDDWG